MAAIKTYRHGPGEAGVLAARAAPADGGAGCRWLMVAAERAGLAGNSFQLSPGPGPGYLPRIATRTPGTGAGSVGAAREYVLAMLQRWDVTERREDIAIVISELLTNAMRHALPAAGHARPQRPIRLGLLQPGPCLLCAVTDPSKAAPVPQAPGPLGETGRGLLIICALSDRWGYTTLSDTGKVVWAVFTSPVTPPLPTREPGPPATQHTGQGRAGDQAVTRPAPPTTVACKRQPRNAQPSDPLLGIPQPRRRLA